MTSWFAPRLQDAQLRNSTNLASVSDASQNIDILHYFSILLRRKREYRPNMGVFDLIIGSDLLYVSENSEILATFINCHLAKNGEVIMIDPCRKKANKFIKKMSTLHLDCTERKQLQSDRPEKLQQFNCYTFKRLHVAEYKN